MSSAESNMRSRKVSWLARTNARQILARGKIGGIRFERRSRDGLAAHFFLPACERGCERSAFEPLEERILRARVVAHQHHAAAGVERRAGTRHHAACRARPLPAQVVGKNDA